MTDEKLLESYLLNHQEECGITLLKNYERYINYISYSPIVNFKTNKTEQEELKMELIVFFFESLPKFDHQIGSFKIFIENKIRHHGRNKAKKIMEHKNNNKLVPTEEMEKLDHLIKLVDEDDATYDYVEMLIDLLPPRQSQIARLRILQNHRFVEIANILYPTKERKARHSITVNNYKFALKNLQKLINEEKKDL
jgi:hypothetical protein